MMKTTRTTKTTTKTTDSSCSSPSSGSSRTATSTTTTSNANNNTAAAAADAAAAARGTLWSIGLRLFSFVCSQLTLKWVDPVALGNANIDLELLFGFTLFLSREGFRLVLTKSSSTTSTSSSYMKEGTNDDNSSLSSFDYHLARETRLVHIVVSSLLFGTWIMWKQQQQQNENYDLDTMVAAGLYSLAAMLEGWAEPHILKALYHVHVEAKVAAEGLATVCKTFATVVALALLLPRQYPVTAFGVAQLVYGMVYLVVVYHQRGILPSSSLSTITATDYLNNGTATFTTAKQQQQKQQQQKQQRQKRRHQVLLFTLQGLFKHALTEGDRIMLLWTAAGAYDKGLFAIASAYGGMAARLVFSPLEENARLLWCKLAVVPVSSSSSQSSSSSLQSLSTKTTTLTTSKNQDDDDNNNNDCDDNDNDNGNANDNDNDNDNSKKQQEKEKQQRKQKQEKEQLLLLLYSSYTMLVKLVLYIGLLLACLGSNYTDLLLELLHKRAAAPVLSVYCVYCLFLALNGMTEAFWYASASTYREVQTLTIIHFGIGILCYAGLAPLMVQKPLEYGTVGLVLANMVSMMLRSFYALSFAIKYFEKTSTLLLLREKEEGAAAAARRGLRGRVRVIQDILPHGFILVAFGVTFVTTRWSLLRFLELEQSSKLSSLSSSSLSEWLQIAAQHIGVGVACLMGIVTLICVLERPYLESLRKVVRGGNNKANQAPTKSKRD